MQIATLVLLRRGPQVLLGRKSHSCSFGRGVWSAPGGKVHSTESLLKCAVRETEEEVGVVTREDTLSLVAVISIPRKEFGFKVYVFITDAFEGNPKATEEMDSVQWFDVWNLPMHAMQPGDKYWFADAVRGKVFEANIPHDEEGSILSVRITHCTLALPQY